MSLRLDPSESILFDRPLTRLVVQEIRLENVDKHPLIFKVKTTAPKDFCVRPNVGHINPRSTMTIKVFRQPLKVEPPLDALSKDKFQILSSPFTSTQAPSSAELIKMWSHIESAEKGRITQHKIKCEYRQPPSPSPPPPDYTALSATIAQHIPPSPLTPTEAPPPSYDVFSEANNQLAELQSKLDSYRQEISEMHPRNPEMNRRKTEEVAVGTEEAVAAALPQPQVPIMVKESRAEKGYSIQVVALVAVIAYALGWLALLFRK